MPILRASDFYPASGALTTRAAMLRTFASRVPPTKRSIPALDASLTTVMRFLCAADATRCSTRLAKKFFGKAVTLLDGRDSSTRQAATSMPKWKSSEGR